MPQLTSHKKGFIRFFSKSVSARRRILIQKTKQLGEKAVVGKLRAIQALNKRTNPNLSEKARQDARFVSSSFVGSKRVRLGFARRKRRSR